MRLAEFYLRKYELELTKHNKDSFQVRWKLLDLIYDLGNNNYFKIHLLNYKKKLYV